MEFDTSHDPVANEVCMASGFICAEGLIHALIFVTGFAKSFTHNLTQFLNFESS